MPNKLEWKDLLRESNALGWIFFFVLVVAIGVGTLLFGGAPQSVKPSTHAASSQASGPNELK